MAGDDVRFYLGLHHPADARYFERCLISVNAVRHRRSPLPVREWMLDSGAFTEVARHGGYRQQPEDYAAVVNRMAQFGQLVAAVSQDWMCEPFVLARTGLSRADHQRLTIERYVSIRQAVRPEIYVMPVLQGYEPADYAAHVHDYGELLPYGAWVGVGSICKRNGSPRQIIRVLSAIKDERDDFRLHGFGLKLTACADAQVRAMLWSADSLAWSYAARRQGRNANDWREAAAYLWRMDEITRQPEQPRLPLAFAR